MKNLFVSFLLAFLFLFLFKTSVLAQSSYVLPYPSSMPGSFAYKLHLVFENVSKYWHFGDLGQYDYNLRMADKYLVEAKTLFEYKQYLLAHIALKKSDSYFSKIKQSLSVAEKKNKDVVNKRLILKEAALKHMEYLEKIDLDTPDIFIWEPEKSSSTTLLLKEAFVDAINIRKDSL